jgi:urate oxidase
MTGVEGGPFIVNAAHGKRNITFSRIQRGQSGSRIFSASLSVLVQSDSWIASYTEGDNRSLVATDSLRNFVGSLLAEHDPQSAWHLAYTVGNALLYEYPHLDLVEVTCEETQLPVSHVLAGHATYDLNGGHVIDAAVRLRRAGDGRTELIAHHVSIPDLAVAKTGGSAFNGFLRDRFTTLPDVVDRPIVLALRLRCIYRDAASLLAAERGVTDTVRTLVLEVCAHLQSKSIQHLIHQIGVSVLQAVPELRELVIEAENRSAPIWDQSGDALTLSEPPSCFGLVTLTLRVPN